MLSRATFIATATLATGAAGAGIAFAAPAQFLSFPSAFMSYMPIASAALGLIIANGLPSFLRRPAAYRRVVHRLDVKTSVRGRK